MTASSDKNKAVIVPNNDIELTTQEKSTVESAFREAKDFRDIGEMITAPLDTIITETTEMIEKDPILNVSGELERMNLEMQGVYHEIIENDGALMRFFKSLPVIGIAAKKLDETIDSAAFNMKDIEGKIGSIFSGFDQSYTSLNTSIEMQKHFIDGIEQNLGGVVAYKNFLERKIQEFKDRLTATEDEEEKRKMEMFLRNVEYFLSNLIVLIGNLEMAEKRLLIRLDSAQKLSLAMNSSKPIFKTLLSSAVIEISGQKAIDASMKAMEAMGKTIDKLSSDLTDKAIEGNRRAEEISSKPILSSTTFVENVTKLKNHFDEIETYRAQVALEAKKEREEFAKAEVNLKNIVTLSKKGGEELGKELFAGASVLTETTR